MPFFRPEGGKKARGDRRTHTRPRRAAATASPVFCAERGKKLMKFRRTRTPPALFAPRGGEGRKSRLRPGESAAKRRPFGRRGKAGGRHDKAPGRKTARGLCSFFHCSFAFLHPHREGGRRGQVILSCMPSCRARSPISRRTNLKVFAPRTFTASGVDA